MQEKLHQKTSQVTVHWHPRVSPLLPEGIGARGASALQLGRRLLQLDDEALGRFFGVAGDKLLVVTGSTELLPWIEGVQYLGRDPACTEVLSPTNYSPSVPSSLLARALGARLLSPGPLAILPFPDPPVFVPLGDARPISRQQLNAWLESQ